MIPRRCCDAIWLKCPPRKALKDAPVVPISQLSNTFISVIALYLAMKTVDSWSLSLKVENGTDNSATLLLIKNAKYVQQKAEELSQKNQPVLARKLSIDLEKSSLGLQPKRVQKRHPFGHRKTSANSIIKFGEPDHWPLFPCVKVENNFARRYSKNRLNNSFQIIAFPERCSENVSSHPMQLHCVRNPHTLWL